MSERKNIKRNANRVKAKDRALYSSIQKSYYKKKLIPIIEEKTLDLFGESAKIKTS